MNQKAADHAIEALCQKGCQEILKTISRMKQGKMPLEVGTLTAEECRWVLTELQAIMAVYDHA